MARITVEDCLEVVDNRFELVMMAAKRARQLANGVEPQLDNNEANDKPTTSTPSTRPSASARNAKPSNGPPPKWSPTTTCPRATTESTLRNTCFRTAPLRRGRFFSRTAAIERLPLLDIPGKSPTAMFSILEPHTRIPPHTGTSNVRVTIHLPLVVPPGCGFRVGSETREWHEGEAWAFDDTIEHEAWNDSDRPRAILIIDTWNPFLTDPEREVIRRIG